MARKRLTDDDITAIVQANIAAAIGSRIGSDGGEDLIAERQKALDYYKAKPLGNEVDGRSKVVAHDVQETVDWLMPSILEIFTAGDDVVRFDPVGPEDEEQAKQATDLCNYIFYKENDGFQILHDMFKDALLQKTGIAKVYWEEKENQKVERYTGLTRAEYDKLQQDESLEFDEETEREERIMVPGPDGRLVEATQTVYDCRAVRTDVRGRNRIDSVPPEEFLFSRRAVKLEDEQGNMIVPFVCHRVMKTISDLVAEGFDYETLKDIPSAYDGEYNEERQSRHNDDDVVAEAVLDASMRPIWLHECYLRIDTDGDGIAETRKILVGGNANKLLLNEEVDEQPFVVITPLPMPHALVGDSVADRVMDLQEIRSTIWRQLLDNVYNVNNARPAVNARVDIDTLLNNAVGSAIMIEGREAVGDSIQWQQTPSIAHHIFPMLEYVDQMREARSGVSRLNQGLDPDALNDTAAGMNMLMTASQRQMMLIARVFAQTGIRDLFRKLLRYTVKYQDKPKTIRLRNQFVEIDPSGWNAQMDVTINVGLGYGSREQQLVARRQILEIQSGIVDRQGGVNGPLIFADHISHAFRKFIEAAGEQQPEAYVEEVNPQQARQPQQPRPDPEMVKVQAETQARQAEMKMKGEAQARELQMKAQSEERSAQVELAKVQAQLKLDRERHQMEMQMMREEHALKLQIAQQDAALKRQTAVMQAQNQAGIARFNAETKADIAKETAGEDGQRP